MTLNHESIEAAKGQGEALRLLPVKWPRVRVSGLLPDPVPLIVLLSSTLYHCYSLLSVAVAVFSFDLLAISPYAIPKGLVNVNAWHIAMLEAITGIQLGIAISA